MGKFNGCKRDASGNTIVEKNTNPILDSRIYDLGFPDICIEKFAVNVLTKNLFNHSDSYG